MITLPSIIIRPQPRKRNFILIKNISKYRTKTHTIEEFKRMQRYSQTEWENYINTFKPIKIK